MFLTVTRVYGIDKLKISRTRAVKIVAADKQNQLNLACLLILCLYSLRNFRKNVTNLRFQLRKVLFHFS